MATITKLNGDSAADTIWSEIDRQAQDLAAFAEMVSNGRIVMFECRHIVAHCNGIRDLNSQHRRGYNPEHDDPSLVFTDRIGRILHSDEFTPSGSPWFLRDMRTCVTRIRDLTAQRLMSHYRQQQAQQSDIGATVRQRQAAHGGEAS